MIVYECKKNKPYLLGVYLEINNNFINGGNINEEVCMFSMWICI